jgi:hypothetical protein
VPFSLDTSGLLDAWVRHYPLDVFPTIWSHMEVAAKKGEILVIDEVVLELKRKDDGIHKWVQEREAMIVPIDGEVQRHLSEIMNKYPRLVDTRKNRSGCDPWVIALARARGLTVVTGEKATGTLVRPKIPDVCKDLGVPCIEIVEFFRKQGWRL